MTTGVINASGLVRSDVRIDHLSRRSRSLRWSSTVRRRCGRRGHVASASPRGRRSTRGRSARGASSLTRTPIGPTTMLPTPRRRDRTRDCTRRSPSRRRHRSSFARDSARLPPRPRMPQAHASATAGKTASPDIAASSRDTAASGRARSRAPRRIPSATPSLRRLVHAERREVFRDVAPRRAGVEHAEPQFRVHHTVQGQIEPPDFFVERLAEEAGLLATWMMPQRSFARVSPGMRCRREDAASRRRCGRGSRSARPTRDALERLADVAQRAGQQHVIGVEPADDVAGGALEAAVDRVGLALVLLRVPVVDAARGRTYG